MTASSVPLNQYSGTVLRYTSTALFPGKLSSVEYYDIDANEWCPAMSMPWVGLKVKCAAVGEVIYVLTGKGLGTKQFKNILEYHTKTDRLALG